MKTRKPKTPKQERYELAGPIEGLQLEGDGGLRHLRLFINGQLWLSFRNDNEDLANHYVALKKLVNAEIRRRKCAECQMGLSPNGCGRCQGGAK